MRKKQERALFNQTKSQSEREIRNGSRKKEERTEERQEHSYIHITHFLEFYISRLTTHKNNQQKYMFLIYFHTLLPPISIYSLLIKLIPRHLPRPPKPPSPPRHPPHPLPPSLLHPPTTTAPAPSSFSPPLLHLLQHATDSATPKHQSGR